MPTTRSRAGAGGAMDEGSGAGAGTGADDKARRKRTPPPKLSAMIPFALGCLAPVPIMMGALDKVPGEKAPRTPVLYEFNKLFKLCGVLFPVMLLVMRMAIKRLMGAATPLPASDRFSVLTCIVVSTIRAVVYLTTLLLKDADEEKRDVMSDHVFLGAVVK